MGSLRASMSALCCRLIDLQCWPLVKLEQKTIIIVGTWMKRDYGSFFDHIARSIAVLT